MKSENTRPFGSTFAISIWAGISALKVFCLPHTGRYPGGARPVLPVIEEFTSDTRTPLWRRVELEPVSPLPDEVLHGSRAT